MNYLPAIALVCAATTSTVDPDSRCSRVSPTQAITFKPFSSAYATLSPTNWNKKHGEWKLLLKIGTLIDLKNDEHSWSSSQMINQAPWAKLKKLGVFEN